MTSSRRTFLTGLTVGAASSAFVGTVSGHETPIDSCTVIDEPGEYEIVADIDEGAQEYDDLYEPACIWIRSSDVVLDGNGYTISGDGEGRGIQVAGPEHRWSDVAAENIVIHDLQVESWGTGISLGSNREWEVEATLEDVVVENNDGLGIFLFMADGSELRNVTANGNGSHGIYLWETDTHVFESVTASENGSLGILFHDLVWDSEFTDITVTDNDSGGIETGIDVYDNTFTDLTIAGNGGAGFSAQDGSGASIQDAVIEDNGGAGISVVESFVETQTVTVRNNDGRQVEGDGSDSQLGSRLTAEELEVGDTAEFAFSEEALSLDAIDQDDLPDLPEDVASVGDGVEIEDVDEVDVILTYDEDDVEGDEVELWRYDGDEWVTTESYDADGSIDDTLTEDGIYAPVADDPTANQIDSPTIIDEPGEYEVVADFDGEAREYDVSGIDVCVWIRSSDVTIEGNGHTISGDGKGTGIQVAGPEHRGSDDAAENVTIRDLQVENWQTGISLGRIREWFTSAVLDNVTAADCVTGIYLFTADGSELRNVAANGNDGSGIYLYEVHDVIGDRLTVSENGRGFTFHDIVSGCEFTDVAVTGNGGEGINTGIDVFGNTFQNLTIADNDGPGIRSMDGGSNTIEDALIENNAGEGILLRGDSETLVDVTIRTNDGVQVDARDGNRLTASGLRIGDDTTFAFEKEELSLDTIRQADLPEFPEGNRAVGDGTEIEDADSLEATFECDEADVDGDGVELWHHDGDEWSTVEAFDADSLEIELSEDGVYAPVEIDSDDSDGGVVVLDLSIETPSVAQGEPFEATITVENQAVETRIETVELRIDDETEAQTELELASGETETVVFDAIETEVWEPDTYEIGAFTEADEATDAITVEEAAADEGNDGVEDGDAGDNETGDPPSTDENSDEGRNGKDRESADGDPDDHDDDDDEPVSNQSEHGADESSTNVTGEDDGIDVEPIEDQTGLGVVSGVSAILGAGYAAKRLAERSDSEDES